MAKKESSSYVPDSEFIVFAYTNILFKEKADDFLESYLLFCCLFLEYCLRKGYLVFSLYSNSLHNLKLSLIHCATKISRQKNPNKAGNAVEGQYFSKRNAQSIICLMTIRKGPLPHWRTQIHTIPLQMYCREQKRCLTSWFAEHTPEVICPIPTPHSQISHASLSSLTSAVPFKLDAA